ncbi:MAG TPA: hypothetical protein VKA83_01300 [Methylomirabilota bacterium]|jgi:hypothetical protein|nr:hypothetical protein [Methylomirabilota bacterium]
MEGLRQIQVVTQGDGWHLVGLDAEGRVWFGSPRRTTKGRMLAWVLMDESVEIADPLEPAVTAASDSLERGVAERHWPAKPRP